MYVHVCVEKIGRKGSKILTMCSLNIRIIGKLSSLCFLYFPHFKDENVLL